MFVGIAIGGCLVLTFGIIGAVMIFLYFRQKKEAEESLDWSSALGKITKAHMRQDISYESGNTLYYPEVEYEYEFLGITYTGDRISFGGSAGNSNRKKTAEILAQYPLNKTVTVYYDPNSPESAVLERKVGMGGKVLLIVGIVFILVALCTLCVGGVATVANAMGY